MDRRPAVQSVTSAANSASTDRDARTRRYLITMAVRVACLILSIALPIPVWARLMFIGGAVVLPRLAVVSANGGDSAPEQSTTLMTHLGQSQLDASEADRPAASSTVFDGFVLDNDWTGDDTTPRRRSA